jgi:hypothetical protein
MIDKEAPSKNGTHYVYDIKIDGTTIYANSSDGIVISYDDGETWVHKSTMDGLGKNRVRIAAVDGNTIYATKPWQLKRDEYTIVEGIWISRNNGKTWVNKTTLDGLGSDKVDNVFVQGDKVFAATDGGLSVSTDGGNTWLNRTRVDGLGYERVFDVLVVGNTIYAGTAMGLSISTDGGITWKNHRHNGLGDDQVWGVLVLNDTIYASTPGGVSISTDGGNTWSNKNRKNGLDPKIISTLVDWPKRN